MVRRGCPLFPPSSALPPEDRPDANPKAVSERTSYYQVRLAFHFLPQVIRWYCTANRFGPPVAFRPRSPCPWQAHLASGLMHTTSSRYNFAPKHLAQCICRIGRCLCGRSAAPRKGCGYPPLALRIVLRCKIVTGQVALFTLGFPTAPPVKYVKDTAPSAHLTGLAKQHA